jgi:hypothetical protein
MVLKRAHFGKNIRNTWPIFEMWCWRRKETISWIDRVRNKVLYKVKEERNISHTIKRRKTNWIGHIVRMKSLLNQILEGNKNG